MKVFRKLLNNRKNARKAKCDALAEMADEMVEINREMENLMNDYGRRNELLCVNASNEALMQRIVTEWSIAVREYAFNN